MTDAAFVIAAYGIVLGSLAGYAIVLSRRSSASRLAERAIRRQVRKP
jgi:hypothetical protein